LSSEGIYPYSLDMEKPVVCIYPHSRPFFELSP
jgi:hypothetical protein